MGSIRGREGTFKEQQLRSRIVQDIKKFLCGKPDVERAAKRRQPQAHRSYASSKAVAIGAEEGDAISRLDAERLQRTTSFLVRKANSAGGRANLCNGGAVSRDEVPANAILPPG